MSSSHSLTWRLASLLHLRKSQGVDGAVRDQVRLHMADTIGIALGALQGPAVGPQSFAAMCAGGGAGPCAVLGTGRMLPPALAAFANSALAHALDYDDIHDAARLHVTPVTLPAALACAQLAHRSLGDVVDATALGSELMCRLGNVWAPSGAGPGADWHLTQLFGVFGACYSACSALGLDEERTASALGLAYMQAAGGKQAAYGSGATARSIYPAFASLAGVNAALLAQAGVGGPAEALEGPAGLFALYLGAGASREQIESLLDEEAWVFSATEIKGWPCCRLSHPYVAAALEVRSRARSPNRLVVCVNASAAKLCEPLAARCAPATLQDAKYSIPFMIAFVIVHGEPTLALLDESALADSRVLEMARHIEIELSLPDGPGHPPARIRVEHNGPNFEVLPALDLRMPPAKVRAKFDDCIAYSRLPLNAQTLWDAILHGALSSPADMLAGVAIPCRTGIDDMPRASLTDADAPLTLGIG